MLPVGYKELCQGSDGLAAIVSQSFGKEFSEDSLFFFCGRHADRMEALYYSGGGDILLYKRPNMAGGF